MSWLIAGPTLAVLLILGYLAWLQAVSRSLGVYPSGPDLLRVVIGSRHFIVGAEARLGSSRLLYLRSVRDTTESGSIVGSRIVDDVTREEVLRRARKYLRLRCVSFEESSEQVWE